MENVVRCCAENCRFSILKQGHTLEAYSIRNNLLKLVREWSKTFGQEPKPGKGKSLLRCPRTIICRISTWTASSWKLKLLSINDCCVSDQDQESLFELLSSESELESEPEPEPESEFESEPESEPEPEPESEPDPESELEPERTVFLITLLVTAGLTTASILFWTGTAIVSPAKNRSNAKNKERRAISFACRWLRMVSAGMEGKKGKCIAFKQFLGLS